MGVLSSTIADRVEKIEQKVDRKLPPGKFADPRSIVSATGKTIATVYRHIWGGSLKSKKVKGKDARVSIQISRDDAKDFCVRLLLSETLGLESRQSTKVAPSKRTLAKRAAAAFPSSKRRKKSSPKRKRSAPKKDGQETKKTLPF